MSLIEAIERNADADEISGLFAAASASGSLDVIDHDRWGITALFMAIRVRNIDLVKKLIDAEVSVSVRNIDGCPFHGHPCEEYRFG
jgi:hypothetical protein